MSVQVRVVSLSLGAIPASAEELRRLPASSVLPIEAAPGDPVRIVVDGRVVAEGTLLDDGGELVVRIDRRI